LPKNRRIKMLRSLLGKKRSQDLEQAGAPKPPPPPPAPTLAETKRAAEEQIDEYLRKVGISDPAAVTDENGVREFRLGSAMGHAVVVESDGELYLYVRAYVMPLPSDKELIAPLMRELLELNLRITSAGRVGISDERVFVAVTRPVTELHADDVARSIRSVMVIADSIDDDLLERYGGTAKKRVAPEPASAGGATKGRRKKAG
jgi:hypothetical protein